MYLVICIYSCYFILGKTTEKKAVNVNKKKSSDREESQKIAHKCSICSEVFKHSKSLKKHLISHLFSNNVKFPFKCDKCNKTFTQKRNMNTHRALIHGVLEI